MEQALVLPLPRDSLKDHSNAKDFLPITASRMKWVQTFLERLSARKISWDEFWKQVPPTEPGLYSAATREGNTVLHIAALQKKDNLPSELTQDRQLLRKRNHYGFTSQELAHFLCSMKEEPFKPPLDFLPEDQESQKILDQLMFFSCPVFESEEIFHHILFHTNKAKEKNLIAPEKTWMGIYFDKEIQQTFHPSIAIRFLDPEVGCGVFAMQRIPSCSFVGEYTGIVREREHNYVKDKTYCVRFEGWELGRKKFIIDAEKGGNFTRFINHSENPNLSLQSVYWRGMPRMIFIALKEIPEGAQLTFDYGTCFWKNCQKTPRSF